MFEKYNYDAPTLKESLSLNKCLASPAVSQAIENCKKLTAKYEGYDVSGEKFKTYERISRPDYTAEINEATDRMPIIQHTPNGEIKSWFMPDDIRQMRDREIERTKERQRIEGLVFSNYHSGNIFKEAYEEEVNTPSFQKLLRQRQETSGYRDQRLLVPNYPNYLTEPQPYSNTHYKLKTEIIK